MYDRINVASKTKKILDSAFDEPISVEDGLSSITAISISQTSAMYAVDSVLSVRILMILKLTFWTMKAF